MFGKAFFFLTACIALLSGCSEYEICGKSGAPSCCAIKYGEGNTVSYCVSSCTDCIKSASESGGAPSCPAEESGWKDTYTNEGCLTGKRSKSIFKVDAEDVPTLPFSPIIRVKMTDDPLDCAAICQDKDSASCAAAKVLPDTAQQLLALKSRLSTAKGEIPISEIHDIFNIVESADNCRRKGIVVSGNRLENNGPFDCDIQTSFSIGKKEIPLTLKISKHLVGNVSSAGEAFSVRFPDDARSGTIVIGDALLNSKYGGAVTNVDVVDGAAYFSTPNSCISLRLE